MLLLAKYAKDAYTHGMTGEQIQQLRRELGEDVDTFGARFHRSGRTVEGWEQGIRNPDPLVLDILKALWVERHPPKPRKRKS